MNATHIRQWLVETFGLNPAKLHDNASLFQSGMLDSFNLLELVAYVEKATGRRVPAIDINADNFDSIAKMLAFLERDVSRISGAQGKHKKAV